MKNFICFFALTIFYLNSYNQNIKSTEIQSWIDENPGELIPIRIEFKNNVNCYELNQQFKDQNTAINQRPKIVNRLLKDQAFKSQKQVLDFLKRNTSSSNCYHSFWIVNIIVALVDSTTIDKLLQASPN